MKIATHLKFWLILIAMIAIHIHPAAAAVPAAPTNLNAVAGNAQIALTWTASSGATSYSVYYGTLPGQEGVTPIATGLTGTSYNWTGLINGIKYYIEVAAVNS